METSNCHGTDQLMEYMLGEINEEDRRRIEHHIGSCKACRRELEEMREAWHAIPYALEEIEAPADLKAEVMDSIFKVEQPVVKKKWTMNTGWIAASVLLLLLIGVSWNNNHLRDRLQAMETGASLPTQVLQIFTLNATDSSSDAAKGSAWLMQQGDAKKLVFSVQGLSQAKGQEAYQVWLIHNGARRSAGVFLVDEQGNGVLTYDMKEQQVPFEAIGITLEPDAVGEQPRGKKVLGT
ncbi:anti-sigma factor [Paenibacillus guangzhouensis]|uniref:anti-sigma factor n=1 Tax=Paenibacillus guangzhouensis TaxID=1473112 RepID=UPI00126721A6|nr:anti-sigma factor [Paenibacillus guangzhouensis]